MSNPIKNRKTVVCGGVALTEIELAEQTLAALKIRFGKLPEPEPQRETFDAEAVRALLDAIPREPSSGRLQLIAQRVRDSERKRKLSHQ